MKIAITGASGLIGGHLGRRLIEDGHELVVLVRSLESQVNFPCQKVLWQDLAKGLVGVEAVFHLAGENIAGARWTEARKKQLVSSRVESAKHLKRGLEEAGAELKFLLTASGVGYYGDRKDELLTEDSTPGTDFLAALCQEWEAAARAIPAKRHVEGRFGVVLTPEGGFLKKVAPLFQMVGGSRLGSGEQYLSWIHLNDLIEGLVFSFKDSRVEGPINFNAPGSLKNSEMTDVLSQTLKTFRAPPVPSLVLKVMYGELSEALLFSQRAVPAKLESLGFRFQFKTFEEAVRELYGPIQAGEIKVVFEHFIPVPRKQVWPFFSSETNLERLTPEFLNFKVLNKSTPELQVGTLIDYQLKLRGVPLKWRTRISEWQAEDYFVDDQLKGPYQKWHHRHEFFKFGGGTLMRDTVFFKVPLGWMGRLASLQFVMGEVEQIFAYRSKAINQIFSTR